MEHLQKEGIISSELYFSIFWLKATFNTAIKAQRAAKLTCYCFGGHFDILSTTLLLQTSSSCLILAGVD